MTARNVAMCPCCPPPHSPPTLTRAPPPAPPLLPPCLPHLATGADAIQRRQQKTCLLMRALMLVWAVVPSCLLAAFCGKRLSSAFDVCASCVGIVGCILPSMWFALWRSDFLGSAQDLAMVSCPPQNSCALYQLPARRDAGRCLGMCECFRARERACARAHSRACWSFHFKLDRTITESTLTET